MIATLAIASEAEASSPRPVLEQLRQSGRPHANVTAVRPSQSRGSYIAKVLFRVRARQRPGSGRTVGWLAPRSAHAGNATRVMVLAARTDATGRPWVRVQLPVRPNQSAGWIPADVALLSHTRWFVRVKLNTRTITVFRRGKGVRAARAVIGAPRTPTPRGLFALYEKARQPVADAFLGPWALHLTAFSEVLFNYGGGPGRVAIHGRGYASRHQAALGSAASHGCVRIDNSLVRWMAGHLRAGTPVLITAD